MTNFALDVNAIKRVMKAPIEHLGEPLKVNLLALVEPESDLLKKVVEYPPLVCDIAYALCKPQCDEKSVSDEEFGRSMGGDVLERVLDLVIEETIDFFPQGRRAVLKKVLTKSQAFAEKAKTLIVEHPVRPGYTLLNQKPTEKTSSAYRFEIALAAGATREFAVSEERVYEQTYAVTGMTPDAVLEYVRNRELSDAARRQMQQIAAQKRQVADNARALADAAAQVTTLTSDETRIRQNIGSLNGVSGQQQQVQNYARQLDNHEQQLATLRDKQEELRKQKTALEAALAGMIDALTF